METQLEFLGDRLLNTSREGLGVGSYSTRRQGPSTDSIGVSEEVYKDYGVVVSPFINLRHTVRTKTDRDDRRQ